VKGRREGGREGGRVRRHISGSKAFQGEIFTRCMRLR
jgi:hypothetical protein